jgi:hypothetical protein
MPVDHSGQEPAAKFDDRGHVDLDKVDFLLWNGFRDHSEGREPGVVDQDVWNQTKRRDPVGQGRPFGAVGQVGGQWVRLSAQPSGEVFETVGAAGYQDDLIAAPRQYLGKLLADP